MVVIFERIADQHCCYRKQTKKRKPVHDRSDKVEVAARHSSPL
jgi:hypothetical protein